MYRIPNRIFVGGIPQTASQDELREYFSHFGHVKDARIITDPRGNSRG
jgi:RNA-binding protein Musashi